MNNKVLAIVGGGCLIVLLCAVCGIGGYFVFQSQASDILAQFGGLQSAQTQNTPSAPSGAARTTVAAPAGAAPTQAPAATTSSGGNPLDALTKTFRGWGSVKSFRARMTVTGVPTGAQDMNLEVVTPDRFHMTSSQFEMILIGNTTYMKIGNQWQKMTLPQGIDLSLANPKTFETEIGASTDVKFIGPEVLDGTPTLVYQYTSTVKGQAGTAHTAKIWVGATDSLPRKIVTSNATIVFSDYNANITINPPIP